MKKIALVGAGSIGGLVAQQLSTVPDVQIILYDIAPGRALGKVLDINHGLASIQEPYVAPMIATEDLSHIQDADIVVITAGIARQPHMTRNDLLQTNIEIFKELSKGIKHYAPHSLVLIVTNPLDTMVWAFQKLTNWPKNRVMGMAGNLDEARLRFHIAQATHARFDHIHTTIIGPHNDTMIPIVSNTFVGDTPITEHLTQENIDDIISNTRTAGAHITNLYQNQSAYMGPALAIKHLVMALCQSQPTPITVSTYFDDDVYIGLRCQINDTGVDCVVSLNLSEAEEKEFNQAVENLRIFNKSVEIDLLKIQNQKVFEELN